FLYIAQAMINIGDQGIGLWNEQDGFFYDVLNLPDGQLVPLEVRSIVGLIPLFAVETLEPAMLAKLPVFSRHMEWFLEHRPDLAKRLSTIFLKNSVGDRQVYSLYPKLQQDPHFRDYINFYEYYDGDTARGVGASHQTGWSGLVAKLLQARAGYAIRS